MFLFIFESIGTSELLLIGIVALIFLGPRKLPQIARTIGKTVADLRNTTNEFKQTWQREVDFEEETRALKEMVQDEPEPQPVAGENSILADAPGEQPQAPAIKEIDPDAFDLTGSARPEEVEETERSEDPGTEREVDHLSDKRTWL